MYGKRNGRRTAALLAVLAIGLAACSGGDDGGDEAADEPTEAGSGPTLTEEASELDPLFEDDLQDDGNGWGEIEDEAFVTAFGPDGYEVSIVGERPGFWAFADAGPHAVEDSSTTIEVAEGSGAADRWYGTTCRLSRAGPLGYYTLTVNGDAGAWRIDRWTQDDLEPDTLADGEDPALEGLAEDGAVEVSGTCVGDGDGDNVDLALAVDGEEIGTASDEDGLAAGISGLAVLALDADEADEPVVFGGIEIRGDETDAGVELTDDFSDPDSGFEEAEAPGYAISYEDGGLRFDIEESVFANVPLRGIPDAGTATVTIDGDVSVGYAGLCLSGSEGEYEFAISADGYASLGFYPADGGDFQVIDEAFEAYPSTGEHRVSVGWATNGETTNLEIYVDDEIIASASSDPSVTQFTTLKLCATVSQEQGEPARLAYTNRDLVVVGEG